MKMEIQEYNGWSNRETWATKLWVDNDQGLYYHAKDMASGYHDDKRGLADALEEWITELLDMEQVFSAPLEQRKALISMSSDIGSLYRVNWYEIAESLLSELVEA
jgi:hypothetical protein